MANNAEVKAALGAVNDILLNLEKRLSILEDTSRCMETYLMSKIDVRILDLEAILEAKIGYKDSELQKAIKAREKHSEEFYDALYERFRMEYEEKSNEQLRS